MINVQLAAVVCTHEHMLGHFSVIFNSALFKPVNLVLVLLFPIGHFFSRNSIPVIISSAFFSRKFPLVILFHVSLRRTLSDVNKDQLRQL